LKALSRERYGLLIGDEEVMESSGGATTVMDPAKGTPVAEVAMAGRPEVDRAVATARAALLGPWSRMRPQERSRRLFRLAEILESLIDDMTVLEARQSGKAVSGGRAEIAQAVDDFVFYAGLADKVMGRTIPVPGRHLAYTERVPVGVCAQIVPWNYPLMMAAWKVAPALAAGCTIVLKPASATPITALLLGEMALEAGIPPGVVNVLPAPGRTVGADLVAHPDVRKITFTGETATGREIMATAARGLKRVSLELGGKSPSVVFADADLEAAAAGSVYAIYYNAGQSCDARSRLLVERSAYDAFLELFVGKAEKLAVGDPLDPQVHVGSLISKAHRDRVHALVEDGVASGARVAMGGHPLEDGDLAKGAFYAPTVLAEVDPSSRVAQEEIFGPVVTVTPFDREDEAVAMANGTPFGLAGSVWTKDAARGMRVAHAIESGLVGLNTPLTTFPGTPFGGFRESGFGRELAVETLNLYLEEKCVLAFTGDRSVNPFRL